MIGSLSALLAGAVGLAGCGSDETTGPTTTTPYVGGAGGAGGSVGGTGGTAGAGATGGAGGATAATGRIVVDPQDPAWLAYEGGASYFLCGPGDPEGFLYRGTRNADGTRDGDQLDLISTLAPTGANGIYFMAVRSHGGDGGPTENPFIDSDPASGLDQDILDQWDTWFAAMDQARITIFLALYDDESEIWATGDTVGADEQAFIETVVNAFEHHDHLIWTVAENYSAVFSAPRAANIAATIRAADDRDHIIAVNQFNPANFALAGDANVDQFSFQSNTSAGAGLHDEVVGLFQTAGGAYNLNLAGAPNLGTGAAARTKTWAIALGGAYTMIFDQDIATTPVSDLEDCGRLRQFMEATDLSGMAPHDELAWGGTEYVLAVPGERYIAYATSPSSDMGLASLPARAWELSWFDTVTGAWEHESTTTSGGGDATFPKPAGIGDEVALYVR